MKRHWIAPALRAALRRNVAALPLAKVLEGEGWTAGLDLALEPLESERRGTRAVLITVKSNGTVF